MRAWYNMGVDPFLLLAQEAAVKAPAEGLEILQIPVYAKHQSGERGAIIPIANVSSGAANARI